MKKTLFKGSLALISFVLITILSCNKSEDLSNNTIEPPAKTGENIEAGNLTPDRIEVTGNTATVTFMQSARLFTLNTDFTKGKEYLAILQEAIEKDIPVKVTVFANNTDIASVSPALEGVVERYRELRSASSDMHTRSSNTVIPNERELNRLFNAVKLPSIPFAYAVDGCYARAHKMRQVLVENGYDCKKLFAYGSLAASNGTCCVGWGYHVAPRVDFRNSRGQIEARVFDPSLFPNGPVTQQAWLNACRNKSCNSSTYISSAKLTQGNVYVRSSNGRIITDDDYSKTDCIIAAYSGLSGCSTPTPWNDCW